MWYPFVLHKGFCQLYFVEQIVVFLVEPKIHEEERVVISLIFEVIVELLAFQLFNYYELTIFGLLIKLPQFTSLKPKPEISLLLSKKALN